jgi:hypothetical protein
MIVRGRGDPGAPASTSRPRGVGPEGSGFHKAQDFARLKISLCSRFRVAQDFVLLKTSLNNGNRGNKFCGVSSKGSICVFWSFFLVFGKTCLLVE